MSSIHEPKPPRYEPLTLEELNQIGAERRPKNPYQIDPNYQSRKVTPGPLYRLPEPPDLSATLAERGSRYGAFDSHAQITQELKAAMHRCANWAQLAPDQQEALEMIQHKAGRILNGDPNYADSWVDIAGYAQLVAKRLQK